MITREWTQKCKSCKGTGLYVGMGELDGAAVVCHSCKGTGEQHMHFEYEEFAGRQKRDGVTHVFRVNPGICADAGVIVKGGVPIAEWEANPLSVNQIGKEMRAHTCPAWWYQSAEYALKPQWNECRVGGVFSQCRYFASKESCWDKWDMEYGTAPGTAEAEIR